MKCAFSNNCRVSGLVSVIVMCSCLGLQDVSRADRIDGMLTLPGSCP